MADKSLSFQIHFTCQNRLSNCNFIAEFFTLIVFFNRVDEVAVDKFLLVYGGNISEHALFPGGWHLKHKQTTFAYLLLDRRSAIFETKGSVQT